MELKLVCFQKAQNQERMKEVEEMHCKKEEMRRYKTIAENERRIKAAEFKAALLEAGDKISSSSSSDKRSYHGVSQSYKKNVTNIQKKSSVPTVSKISNRADSSPLRSRVYYSCAEPSRLEKNINVRRST